MTFADCMTMLISSRRILVRLTLLAVYLSLSAGIAHSFSQTSGESISTGNPYKQGLEKLQSGDWHAAVKTWGAALKKQEVAGRIEMKMAVSYIRTVTKYGQDSLYTKASNYYLNAFRQAGWKWEAEALKQEFARLMPIVPRSEQKEWKKEIKKEDPAIFDKVVKFWMMQDPIVSTDVNERVIEHWRRIAYAREHFTRAHNTVYHTDDRGLIYVKYGKPDVEEKNVVTPPNEIEDPIMGGPLRVNGMTFHPMIPLILDTDIWRYNFSNRNEPSYYLFGSDVKGGGGYGLQVGIMHMIPTYGYSFTMAGLDRDGGALMIKYSMIRKLLGVTGYYHEIYRELTNAIIAKNANRNAGSAVFEDPGILHQFEFEEVEQSNRRDRESPASTTSLVTGSNQIPIDYNYFRYLNKENKTEYLLVLNPKLKKLDKRLDTKNLKKHPVKDLSMKSSLLNIDNNGRRHVFARRDYNLLQIMDTRGNISYFFNPDTTGYSPITSIDIFGDVGIVEHPTRFPMNIFSNNGLKHDSVAYQGVQPIFSTGPLQLDLPQPLKWKPGKIEISDPILGYRQNVNENKRIPFTPVLDPTFWNGDEILVFFEVYDHNIPNYSIEFSYEKYRDSILLKKPKAYNQNANVTALFKREANHERKWFYLKLNGFETGAYNLKMTVRDNKGNIQETRTVNFRIAEAPGG